MKQPKTRQATLYRLMPDVRGSHEEMFDAYDKHISARTLDEMGADIRFIEVGGTPAIWIGIQEANDTAPWCADASVTTGLDLAYTKCRSSGVLLLGVDGTAYAMSYGAGHLLIPDALKDQRFGLRFLIRRLDAEQVRDLVRRRANARGRIDSTVVAAGAPAWMLGNAENVEIIRRIGGRAKDLKVTFSSRDDRPVNVEGSVGLKMRFGVEGPDLVTDIRECARVCREEEPDPALAFIDWIQPVADPVILAGLDASLEELLSGTADSAAGRLVPVVPTSVLGHYGQADGFTVRIGHARPVTLPALDLECFLRRTRLQRPGERVTALRGGRVCLMDGGDVLGSAPADRWLEASVPMGTERYFLMDGDWFEIGADYVRASRDEIGRLFPATPSVTLPPWSLADHRTEYDYNTHVADGSCGRFLCLDKNRKVRNPLGARSPLEICDLFPLGNELVHVKRAEGSAPLSHLFSQGLVAVQNLLYGPATVRSQFAAEVARLGRVLPDGFTPKKVVFAILMDNGRELTPDTLFPFSQVTLAHTARILGTHNIAVEVIGIPAA